MATYRKFTAKRASLQAPALPLGKHVRFDRDSRDHGFYFDRQYLGSRGSRFEAEQALNAHVYELLERGLIGRDYDLTPLEALDLGALVGEVIA